MLAKDKSIEVDGCSGFVFTAKSGRPLMPNGVNSVLYNIVDAYHKTEVERAKKEHRKASYKKCSYRSCSGFGNRTWGCLLYTSRCV